MKTFLIFLSILVMSFSAFAVNIVVDPNERIWMLVGGFANETMTDSYMVSNRLAMIEAGINQRTSKSSCRLQTKQ